MRSKEGIVINLLTSLLLQFDYCVLLWREL